MLLRTVDDRRTRIRIEHLMTGVAQTCYFPLVGANEENQYFLPIHVTYMYKLMLETLEFFCDLSHKR